MSELQEILGTVVKLYNDASEFTTALGNVKPTRLHTFFNQGFLGIGNHWTASFVDQKGAVYGYILNNVGDDFKEKSEPIYAEMGKSRIIEVDGMITVSERDGSIYHVFQTDTPDQLERVEASYESWITAVSLLPVNGTLVQYLKNSSTAVIDATHGNDHLVTTIDENSGMTLDSTLERLKQPYALRDNGSVISWYLDLKNE